MTELAILLALGTLAVGAIAALLLRLLPSMRLQLAALALLAVVLPLAGVLASGCGHVRDARRHRGPRGRLGGRAERAARRAPARRAGSARRSTACATRTAQLAAGDLAARAAEQGPAELADVARAVNAMADSIERLFDARRELVAWASHDLRTPLASMQAMLEAIDDGLARAGASTSRRSPTACGRSRRWSTTCSSSRASTPACSRSSSRRPTRAASSARACAASRPRRAHAASASRPRPRRSLPPVLCAPDKVERVLHNLLTNALRHTPADGAIAVVVSPDARGRHDRGRGHRRGAQRRDGSAHVRPVLARRALAHERPARASGSRSRARLVEAQGGRIWAENRAGGGARVAFTLPAA